MAFTIEQLETPLTDEQALEELRGVLADFGFSSKSWQSGSVQLTILYLGARVYSKLTEMVSTVSKAGYNSTSTKTALTKFSKSVYDNDRIAAVKTVGPLELTTASGEGPHAVAIGDLLATDGTRTYRNTQGGTLTDAAPVSLTFEAEVAGEDGNVAINTITTLQTPLAGVTVNNPEVSGGVWYTTAGVDEESDAKLITRNVTKWATLNPISKPKDGYINLALSASAGVEHVKVDASNPRGENTIDVYIAGASVALLAGGTEELAVQAAFDAKKPPSMDPDAVVASQLSVTVSGTVYLVASYNTAANQATIEQAIRDYVVGTGIGGLDLSPGPANLVPEDGIKDAIRNSVTSTTEQVIKNVDLTAPVGDITPGAFQIPVVTTIALTYQSV